MKCWLVLTLMVLPVASAQDATREEIERGSRTAKGGFRNEDDVRDKFNRWKTDPEARAWLKAMHYTLGDIKAVKADKPHGQKADVRITVTTTMGSRTDGLSIKLVSSSAGFNQVDKRWLRQYAEMWEMPENVVQAMKLYLGESLPVGDTRRPERTYLDELPESSRAAVIQFFRDNKRKIVSDLLAGQGESSANWFMVTLRAPHERAKWTIRSMEDTIAFYAEGDVEMTRGGNLKIGRVSMQRKGGDNGRDTAKMLQFKINPVQLFSVAR